MLRSLIIDICSSVRGLTAGRVTAGPRGRLVAPSVEYDSGREPKCGGVCKVGGMREVNVFRDFMEESVSSLAGCMVDLYERWFSSDLLLCLL